MKPKEKTLKTAFMNMVKVLEAEMNESLNEIYENANSGRDSIKQLKT